MDKKNNPLVFLDVSIDKCPARTMKFELFSHIVPKTAENFRALCTGESGDGSLTEKHLHLKGSTFRPIDKTHIAWVGEFSQGDDKPSALEHHKGGLLSWSNSGFFITFHKAPELEKTNNVFGKLVEGRRNLDFIGSVGLNGEGNPGVLIEIVNSGVVISRY